HDLQGTSFITYSEPDESPPANKPGRYPEYKEYGFCTVEKCEWEYPGVSYKGSLITSFMDAICKEEGQHKINSPIVSAQDTLDTMSVCLAAEKSLITQKPELVSYLDLS
ncbi:MAG: hypothetical protein ACOCQD_05515, partial [archaeon]